MSTAMMGLASDWHAAKFVDIKRKKFIGRLLTYVNNRPIMKAIWKREGWGSLARPEKCRCICSMPAVTKFCPVQTDGQQKKPVVIRLDEYEVMRLLDVEQFTQEQCAQRMNIARTTVTRMYNDVRKKIAGAIVNGNPLMIDGGNIMICNGKRPECINEKHCCHRERTKMGQTRMEAGGKVL